jgi:hypothetical protein
VRVDARQFGEENPNPDGAFRDFEAKELFDCKTVTEVVGEGAEVVDTIGERDNLLVELRFAGLLDAGVEVSDLGIETNYDFAVDFEYEAEHAVGGRVLRSHIKDHVLVTGALGSRRLPDWSTYVKHQR